MTINWDGLDQADVAAWLAAHPAKPAFGSKGWWESVLWFGLPPDELYANAKEILRDQVGGPLARTGRAMADDAAGVVKNAAADATRTTVNQVLPIVAIGALALLALQVVRAR